MSTDTAAVGGSERPAAMGNSGHTLTCAVRLSFGWAPGGCAWLPWGPESGRSRQVGDWGSNLWRRRRQGVPAGWWGQGVACTCQCEAAGSPFGAHTVGCHSEARAWV